MVVAMGVTDCRRSSQWILTSGIPGVAMGVIPQERATTSRWVLLVEGWKAPFECCPNLVSRGWMCSVPG